MERQDKMSASESLSRQQSQKEEHTEINFQCFQKIFLSRDDMARAIKKLRILGGGFAVIPVGGRRLVQSVPGELNMDHTAVLQKAEVRTTTVKYSQKSLIRIFDNPLEIMEILLCINWKAICIVFKLDCCPTSLIPRPHTKKICYMAWEHKTAVLAPPTISSITCQHIKISGNHL